MVFFEFLQVCFRFAGIFLGTLGIVGGCIFFIRLLLDDLKKNNKEVNKDEK